MARYSQRALNDIDEILDYLSGSSPASARRFREAIERTERLIDDRPFVGIANARQGDFRSCLLPGFPYRLHYRILDAGVFVVHIRHGARAPLGSPG